ncbi:HPr kinase/phosphorylase [Phaeovulum sp. W22_SRMD_FR3]|uniref:HPr kinase/phosphorylase n=1 Tax=Phaeovulum sp. W22_SRMD_FR3 TaxID=3240274 RepID=UPI003F996DEA
MPDLEQDDADAEIWHASCVAVAGCGILILGASGRGKSSLALEFMAWGADLIADDRTILRRQPATTGDSVWACAPAAIHGRIEARGIGILSAKALSGAKLALVIDLDRTETERLPPRREMRVLEVTLPMVLAPHSSARGHFSAGIMQYLKGGRAD